MEQFLTQGNVVPNLGQGIDLGTNRDNAFESTFPVNGLGPGNPFARASHASPAGASPASMFPSMGTQTGSGHVTSVSSRVQLGCFNDGAELNYGRGDILFTESDPSRSEEGVSLFFSVWTLNEQLRQVALSSAQKRKDALMRTQKRGASARTGASMAIRGKRSRNYLALLDFLPRTMADVTQRLNFVGVMYGDQDGARSGAAASNRIRQSLVPVTVAGQAEIPNIWPSDPMAGGVTDGDVVGLMFKVLRRDQVALLPNETVESLPEEMIQVVPHWESGRSVPINSTDRMAPASNDLYSYETSVVMPQRHPDQPTGLIDFDRPARRTGEFYEANIFTPGIYVRLGRIKNRTGRSSNSLKAQAIRDGGKWHELRHVDSVVIDMAPQMNLIHSNM